MIRAATDPRPGAAAFARRCRGRAHPPWAVGAAPTDPVRAEVARYWLLLKLLRRKRWAVHRHVHLVAAFEDAASRAPVSSMLSVGCGLATSELLLALDHPEVEFTLTDYDEERLVRPREIAGQLGLTNVRFASLDLLDPAPLPAHDLVVSVEVLEHITDDRRALATMVDLSRRFLWVLVPYCDERQFLDPRIRRQALERHEHVRPGYTHELLAERFAEQTTLWQRNCYFQPEAEGLRQRMGASRGSKLLLDRVELFDEAVRDVRPDRVTSGRAALGVEILAQVDGVAARRPDGDGAVAGAVVGAGASMATT